MLSGVLRWLGWWRPPFLYRVCLVNVVSDPDLAFRGVPWQMRGAWLVLRHAALIKPTTAATPIDGEVIIHRSNVSFVQVLPEAAS
jgi:hypothetical protein